MHWLLPSQFIHVCRCSKRVRDLQINNSISRIRQFLFYLRMQCSCGNTFGKYGMSTSCNVFCQGNANQICGGLLANNIYSSSYISNFYNAIKLKIYSIKMYLIIDSINSPILNGCYGDNTVRDLNGITYLDPSNTIESCIGFCLSNSYMFASVQNG